jgi:hypothetical protein
MARPLTHDQRGRIAEKIMDLGNYGATGMILAQFVSGQFNVWLFLLGATIFVETYFIAYRLLRGGEQS